MNGHRPGAGRIGRRVIVRGVGDGAGDLRARGRGPGHHDVRKRQPRRRRRARLRRVGHRRHSASCCWLRSQPPSGAEQPSRLARQIAIREPRAVSDVSLHSQVLHRSALMCRWCGWPGDRYRVALAGLVVPTGASTAGEFPRPRTALAEASEFGVLGSPRISRLPAVHTVPTEKCHVRRGYADDEYSQECAHDP
jgi:hypothetical protein